MKDCCRFAIEEFGDPCRVYGSDIPHGDRLYGAVDVSSGTISARRASETCSLIAPRASGL
jgi:hypothetical protein